MMMICVRDADMLLMTQKFALVLIFETSAIDRIETSIHCAEWSQFVVDYLFFGNLIHPLETKLR